MSIHKYTHSYTILAEPELTIDTQHHTETKLVHLEDNITLICPFKNFNDFAWYKNGELYDNQTEEIVFQNVSHSDEGDFSSVFFFSSNEIVM